MGTRTVQIIGFGASTPVGRNVWASAAAVRAGVTGFREHPFMIDSAGEPMRVAMAPWMDLSVQRGERYCELVFSAVDEALGFVRNGALFEGIRVGFAVALPADRPGRPRDLSRFVTAALSERYSRLSARVTTFDFGHAAGYMALDSAMNSLATNKTDVCVVAGVDTYLVPETLEWIEACEQLHGGGPLNNAWGFVPGEAAGVLMMTTPRIAERLNTDILADVVAVGLGRETNLIKTDSVCIGEGLTAAFRGALDSLAPSEQIHNVFCDLNGETYRADEYGFTALRTKERFRAATDFVAPADIWGDVGAAGAPLHVSLALISHRKGYGKGPLSMAWGSSESGERGAAVVRALPAYES